MKVTRIFEIPRYQLEKNPLDKALVTKENGVWEAISTRDYLEKAACISRGLLKMGVQNGDKIALISSANCTAWSIMDIGIAQISAVSVPIYPTISENDYKYIFKKSEIKYCFLSDQALYEKIEAIRQEVPSLEAVYSFQAIAGVKCWEEVLHSGADRAQQKALEERMEAVKPEDLATLIYTSGTTGKPKGVMLSHRNVVRNVLDSQDRVPQIGLRRALSFLPACHIFERIILYLYQLHGISIYFAERMETLSEDLQAVKPDIISVVPRLVEKIYDKISTRGAALKGIKRALFFWSVALGSRYEPYARTGLGYRLRLALARKLVLRQWRKALGGRLKILVSGSAALQPRLTQLFSAAEMLILEGYGATEISPIVSVNTRDKTLFRLGTVGKPIRNVKVKIAEDGEILINGPNVMLGYYRDEAQTRAVIDPEGYYHTGDIGTLKEGFLRITDRKKEVFKTSGGKYIAPQPIENLMKQSRFIEQIAVIGEGEKMPAALIQIDFEFVREWAKLKRIEVGESRAELAAHEAVRERIHEEVKLYNQELGHWEQLKDFGLTHDVWTIEGQQLTPTLKPKRKQILLLYRHLYERIYSEK